MIFTMRTRKKIKQTIYQYSAVFELNKDGAYTVTVPVLPGLVTEGRNLEEAREMAADAVRCYIEGLRKSRELIPLEREIAHIRLSVRV